jgi:hypothetical protein
MSATNIIPFDGGKLPAHIKARMGQLDLGVNNALGVAFSGPPRISLEGRKFSVVKDGKTTIINDPRTDEPAQSIQVVIIRANGGENKAYYADSYNPGVSSGPACFSNDGKRPDPASRDPQAKSCAMCPHNQFGSAICDGIPGKGKACSDSKWLSVASPDRLDQPMQLRVPATSLKNLRLYGKFLRDKGVTFQLVGTKISFDPQVTHQQLVFTPVGFMPDDVVEAVFGMQESESVLQMTGESPLEADEAPALAPPVVTKKAKVAIVQDVEDDDEDEAEATLLAAKLAEAKAKAKAKPAPAPAIDDEDDEEEEIVPVKKKAKIRQDAAPAAKADDDGLEDSIGAFLGGAFDDD